MLDMDKFIDCYTEFLKNSFLTNYNISIVSDEYYFKKTTRSSSNNPFFILKIKLN